MLDLEQYSSDIKANAELYEVSVLGKQVHDFMKSDVGRYMLQRADFEVNDAFEKLKTCDAANVNEVRRLQNNIWVAESVKTWMAEAVGEGLRALDILEDRE